MSLKDCNISCTWYKFSKYDDLVSELIPFKQILKPNSKAQYSEYNALENPIEFLVSFANLAKESYKLNHDIKKKIHKFVDAYGTFLPNSNYGYEEDSEKIFTHSLNVYRAISSLTKLKFGDKNINFNSNAHCVEYMRLDDVNISYKVEREKIYTVFHPKTLGDVANFALMFECMDDIPRIRVCKKCKDVFFAKNTKAEFCSHRCRNQYNVGKSRGKIKDHFSVYHPDRMKNL